MNKIRIFNGLTLLTEKKLIVIVALLLLLTGQSCRIDGDRIVDRERFTFKTGDDTELFFKNVRQSDYDMEENKAARFNVFRHENRPVVDSIPWLMPSIVINYLQDEAYILLEPSTFLSDLDSWQIATSSDTIILNSPNRLENLVFATTIYEHLKTGDSIYIQSDNGYVPLFSERKYAEVFRITMVDYYRLTRVF